MKANTSGANICEFDFVTSNTAKIIPFKSLTLCGTPDYIAPELIQHQGKSAAEFEEKA